MIIVNGQVRNKLLVISGPTATGKTKLALRLASIFDGELINADSRQIYQGLDIVTGKDILPESIVRKSKINIQYKRKNYKPIVYVIRGIPLWMYDVVKPVEEFSVAHYQFIAQKILADIWARGRLPIAVGGTGLYLRSLVVNLPTFEIPPNIALRKKLAKQQIDNLQDNLRFASPERWQNMNQSDRQNPRRLLRAIEVAQWQRVHKLVTKPTAVQIDSLWVGLSAPSDYLKELIRQRVMKRWQEGALSEAKKISGIIKNRKFPVGTTLGLSTLEEYRKGELTRNEMIDRWVLKEYRYSRRQLTWFRKQAGIHWFDISKTGIDWRVTTLVRQWYTQDNYDQ